MVIKKETIRVLGLQDKVMDDIVEFIYARINDSDWFSEGDHRRDVESYLGRLYEKGEIEFFFKSIKFWEYIDSLNKSDEFDFKYCYYASTGEMMMSVLFRNDVERYDSMMSKFSEGNLI